MDKIGVIYIGANSVKFTLMTILKTGYYKIIDESTSDIKLATDLIYGNTISDKKITLTLDNVRSFKSLCKASSVNDIIAVANCSLSKAKNIDTLFNEIKTNFNIDVTLLSESDEIKSTFLAVVKSMHIENSLIIDICGASTHLSFVQNGKLENYTVIPFGTLTHAYKYDLRDRVLPNNLISAIDVIKDSVSNISWIKDHTFDSVICVGGTARAIYKIDRNKKRYPFDIVHNYEMTKNDVHHIYNLVKSKNYKQRINIEGLSKDRADLIVGGSVILNTILNYIDCDKIIISGRGLREGIMFHYIENNYGEIKDVLDFNLNGIMDYLHINKTHSFNLYHMTQKLFNSLYPIHKFKNTYDNVIKTSSLLHDSGISIDYYHHYRHSFYVILNSNINGLSHKELIMSALIGGTHLNLNNIPITPYLSIINKLDIKAINYISVLLSISEELDRSFENAIKDINVEITDSDVIITITSDLNLELEISHALLNKEIFLSTFCRNLIIKQKNK
ncbi:Ppx/GppA phosphatase family protein [Clostridium sp. BJN0001]|uniref:Ppx/GppA phosphatase family protein n=1 Tax=Clostridium sp. BJN0001 TaxID=2930219 RepID=UPI001FD5B0DE|nr:Ppx/GppA phosphatase family protein [Clostridium sp. BJN0001]